MTHVEVTTIQAGHPYPKWDHVVTVVNLGAHWPVAVCPTAERAAIVRDALAVMAAADGHGLVDRVIGGTADLRVYHVGELLTLRSGERWRVDTLHRGRYGRPGVGLVNPDNPRHGTSFYADVLDELVVERRPSVITAAARVAAYLAQLERRAGSTLDLALIHAFGLDHHAAALRVADLRALLGAALRTPEVTG
ncbi:hypothetical protein [Amycolatopsis sp. NBC_01480]|uniref:hypothetical protein n=1 Tax=Amycolatopsis sp. NBC_01480 TaxID=2903562 RepID=UPI002E2BA22A|nr:hypothetical protein [Amycolatopsis sp. NBC_01480]